MKVILDGQIYHLQSGTNIVRRGMQEWPNNIRYDGQQQRKDRSLLSSWAFDNWSGGLGARRIELSRSDRIARLWDAENCDTRHSDYIILSPRMQVPTIVPSRGDLKLWFEYNNDVYFAETNTIGTAVGNVQATASSPIAFKYTGSLIGSHTRIGETTSIFAIGSLSAVKAIGGEVAMVGWINAASGAPDGNRYLLLASLGATYYGQTHPQIMDIGTGGVTIDRYARIENVGGTLYIIDYRSARSAVNFWFAGLGLGSTYPQITAVSSYATVVGTELAPLITNGLEMYAALPEGIFNFDASPAAEIDTKSSIDKNALAIFHKDLLYFKNRYSLMRYNDPGITSAGYDMEDGLPKDKMGEITALCSSWKYLYASVKGATYSHILAYDGAWQYYARIPTAGAWVRDMFINSAPDGIDRLWCIFGNYDKPGFFYNPLIRPDLAGTYLYAPTGYFTVPEFDGGMAEVDGAFYDMAVRCGLHPGLNWDITCLTNMFPTVGFMTLGVVNQWHLLGSPPILFGSPYGNIGKTLQTKYVLNCPDYLGEPRGSTPLFASSVIHYLKIPDERETFEFTIDMVETSQREARPIEAIIGSLNYVRSRKPLLPFWYGQVATKAVKVLDMPSVEMIEEDKIYEGGRKGLVSVKLAEII